MKNAITLLMLLLAIGCKSVPDIDIPDLPWDKDDKPAPVEPAPAPEPVVHPDHINWHGKTNTGGDGLYKPWDYHNPAAPQRSRLWLLPLKHANGSRFLAEHLKSAGEYYDKEGTRPVMVSKKIDGVTKMVPRYFNWPDGPWPFANQPIDGKHPAVGVHPGDGSMYFSGRVKTRDAFASAPDTWYVAKDNLDRVAFSMQIKDPNIRQGK